MATQALPYAYITLAQIRQQLANRLYDASMVFWSSAELTVYVQEALETWNALTGYWRGDFVVPTVASQTWYDIPALANTLRPYTVTDQSIYSVILYHLLEPITGVASVQFTNDDISQAVARRRDELLSITSCTQTVRTVGAVAGRITLPDTVIDVRRMAYLPTESVLTGKGYGTGRYGFGIYGRSAQAGIDIPAPSVVWPEDTFAEQSYDALYTLNQAGQSGLPSTYLLSTQPPLSFDTNCPPAFAGSYELLTVEAGGTLAFGTAPPATFTIPDDWTPAIKWGALADLFSRESNAQDPLRAQYCEQRYRQLAAILRDAAPALLAMRVNNVPAQVSSVRGADLYNTSWQGADPGVPRQVSYSGMNLFALNPPADDGINSVPYDLTVTVVENAPIPTLDDDMVQVARDDLDVLLDYCVHIAMLKAGGADFMATMPLFKRFMKQAALYNRKLSEFGEYTDTLMGMATRERNMNPVQQPVSEDDDA
jgi:hypothetical protein